MSWDFASELNRFGPLASVASMSLASARRYCADVTRSHYENFSVVSLLLPRHLQPHFEAVYAYCRWSDDLADETAHDATPLLRWWREQLSDDRSTQPVIQAVRDTIRRFDMPMSLFTDLLSAFEQDQKLKEYQTWEQLLDYCRRSANPVGRIVLRLFQSADHDREALSDDICTGLQLANFWQDIARDYAIGRVYIPRDELKKFQIDPADFRAGKCTEPFRSMLRSLVDRTRPYFDSGPKLLKLLPFRARLNIGVFHRGGLAVLDAIERARFDVLTSRPTVSSIAKFSILLRSTMSACRFV